MSNGLGRRGSGGRGVLFNAEIAGIAEDGLATEDTEGTEDTPFDGPACEAGRHARRDGFAKRDPLETCGVSFAAPRVAHGRLRRPRRTPQLGVLCDLCVKAFCLCAVLLGAVAQPGVAAQGGVGEAVRIHLVPEAVVTTRTARVGDVVRFRTAMSASVGGRSIPAGTAATGTVVRSRRAGRIRGRAELEIGSVAILTPEGAPLAVSDDVVSGRPPTSQPPSDAHFRLAALGGTFAGLGAAAIASRTSDSAETITAVGLATVGAVMTLALLWPRGPDAVVDRSTAIDLVFRPPPP